MRRSRTIIVTALVVTVVFVIPAIFILPAVCTHVGTQLIDQLTARGIRASTTDLKGTWRGVNIARLELWVPVSIPNSPGAFPVSLELTDISVSLGMSLSPWEIPTTTFTANLYGGRVAGRIEQLLEAPRLRASLSSIDLSAHPQLRTIGVEQSRLSGSVEGLPLQQPSAVVTTFSLSLRDSDIILPPIVSNYAHISAIRGGVVDLKGILNADGAFSISPVTLDSSLLLIRGEATGRVSPAGYLSALSSTLRVELIGSDGQALADWLPLVTNNQLESSNRAFAFTVKDQPCAGRMSSIRVGKVCLTTSFSPLRPIHAAPQPPRPSTSESDNDTSAWSTEDESDTLSE